MRKTLNRVPTAADTRPYESRGRLWLDVIVGVLAVALAGWGVWDTTLKDRLRAKRLHPVTQGVWRSGQLSEHVLTPTLRWRGIDRIVSMTHDPGERDHEAEMRVAERLGIERRLSPLSGDGTGAWVEYVNAMEDLVEGVREGRRVLIHCSAGTERTGGLVALWRVYFEGVPAETAWREACRVGHDPRGNPRLAAFLNRHGDQIAGEMLRRGLIAELPSRPVRFPEAGGETAE